MFTFFARQPAQSRSKVRRWSPGAEHDGVPGEFLAQVGDMSIVASITYAGEYGRPRGPVENYIPLWTDSRSGRRCYPVGLAEETSDSPISCCGAVEVVDTSADRMELLFDTDSGDFPDVLVGYTVGESPNSDLQPETEGTSVFFEKRGILDGLPVYCFGVGNLRASESFFRVVDNSGGRTLEVEFNADCWIEWRWQNQ